MQPRCSCEHVPQRFDIDHNLCDYESEEAKISRTLLEACSAIAETEVKGRKRHKAILAVQHPVGKRFSIRHDSPHEEAT